MTKIKSVRALEILDSRGRPTVKAFVELESGIRAMASVPSGASRGDFEAIELRDEDPNRYGGWGCKQAVGNINGEMNAEISGKSFSHPFELDKFLIDLDGTPNKSRLGANAILAVSLAFVRAKGKEADMPLYQFFSYLIEEKSAKIPELTINLFSGGQHAGGIVPIQDSLIVPHSGGSVSKGLEMAYDVYQCAAQLMHRKYGMRLLTADEGGLSPNFQHADEMLELTLRAIEQAGYNSQEVSMALDVAASHFYKDGHYWIGESPKTNREMIEILRNWVEKYPIISLEDGLDEEDWEYWPKLLESLSGRTIIMGDDLLCTHVDRIQKAIKSKAANALLLKVNQIGTIYEASKALNLARNNGWTITVSARSGETEDNWLADLAVGWKADYIKIGSINQSERLAKYNRLLEIEAETSTFLHN